MEVDEEEKTVSLMGLKRFGMYTSDECKEDDDYDQRDSLDAIILNRRGVPARKRKKNSLIYGSDDLVSIPIRSPRKRGPKSRDSELRKKFQTANKYVSNEGSDDSKLSKYIRNRVCISAGSSPVKLADSFSRSRSTSPPHSMLRRPQRRCLLNSEPDEETPELLSSPERDNAQRLGLALRNLLKLPKAYRWVCCEFFYSNIDEALFVGENDFMVCLRESLPRLRTRFLTRVEWCKIRCMMGKPRRCSATFLAEERLELCRKRQKIRGLQQRKPTEPYNLTELPSDIPMHLTVGTRITARLRSPQDGLFMGTVDAFDSSNNTYRVTFDRAGLGTHSIPDTEIASTLRPELIALPPLLSAAKRPPMPFGSPIDFSPFACSAANYESSPLSIPPSPLHYSPLQRLNCDPLMSAGSPTGKVIHVDGELGGYPISFLGQIVRLSSCLRTKRDLVDSLRSLNSLGEMRKSFGDLISEDFQQRYASNVVELSNINRSLDSYLETIRHFTHQYAPEACPTISLPIMIRECCQEEAYDIVNKTNVSAKDESKERVESPRMLALVSSLTSLMLQIKVVAEGERNSFELEAMQDACEEIKRNLFPENLVKFQDSVEVHMKRIQSGLSPLANLHAFTVSKAKLENKI